MAVNKVEANGETLIDLTNDTVQASDVLKGKTLHLASGVQAEGTYDHDSKQDTFVDLWEAEIGSAGVNELDIDELSDFIDNYSTLLITISNEFDNAEIIRQGVLSTAYCNLTDLFMTSKDGVFVLIVFPRTSEPIHYDHVLAYISILQNWSVPDSKSILVTGTRDETLALNKLTGLYLRKIVGIPISGWKLAVLSGYMPLTFPSNGDDLLDYRVYGTAEGAGETKNLLEITTESQTIKGVTFTVDKQAGTVTATRESASSSDAILSIEIPDEVKGQNVYFSGCPSEGSANTYNIYTLDYTTTLRAPQWDGTTLSVTDYGTSNNNEVRFIEEHRSQIRLRVKAGYDAQNVVFKPMLRRAETTPDFEPFGYKIPFTIMSGTQTKDTVVPIGNTKLMAGDYIDYKSGKIFKAKRIHEDTVNIDGIVWDILDYDHDEVYKADGTRAKHTVTIQTHDIIDNLQYSARQAAFAFPNGLVAGTYHFTIGEHPWVSGDVNKVLTFTLANAIPSGGQLVFNGAYNQTLVGTTISVFASPTSTMVVETVTMTEGDTGTDLGTMLRSKTDAINSIDRALRGSNNWLESAMRQFINSDKAAGNVWTPQTAFDRPPTWASTTAGFLHGIDPDFVAVLGNVKKTTGLNNISDGGGAAVHDEKFFLLSRSEVYMGDEYTGGEGTPYAYYKNYSDNQSPSTGADSNRIKYRAGIARFWWLRSPGAGSANSVRRVTSSGAWGGNYAVDASGVAPACCIVLDDMDDWVKQTFYTEVTADLPTIETFNGENTLDSTVEVGEVTIKGKIKH